MFMTGLHRVPSSPIHLSSLELSHIHLAPLYHTQYPLDHDQDSYSQGLDKRKLVSHWRSPPQSAAAT
jgi:hypothetical protein